MNPHIPVTMRLKVMEKKNGRWKGVNLWLPLFLLWILLLPLFLLAFAAWILLRLLGTAFPGPMNAARFIEAGCDVLRKISDLRIDIRSHDSRFILHF